jgi:hypothetical protein
MLRLRYMVHEIEPAVEFYTKHLGFETKMKMRLILRCLAVTTWTSSSARHMVPEVP